MVNFFGAYFRSENDGRDNYTDIGRPKVVVLKIFCCYSLLLYKLPHTCLRVFSAIKMSLLQKWRI